MGGVFLLKLYETGISNYLSFFLLKMCLEQKGKFEWKWQLKEKKKKDEVSQ